VVLTPWLLPRWQVNRSPELRVEGHSDRENEVRERWAQIIGGILVLAALCSSGQTFDFQRYRFANAMDQLGAVQAGGKRDANGNPQINLNVRLDGIHALERIAHDSPKDHWSVMEVLTTYVRENSSATGLAAGPSGSQLRAEGKYQQPETQWQPPRADIQAILTVIGRRDFTHDPPGRSFDLQNTDLRAADLFRAVLRNGYFYGANLSGANLEEADLSEVSLGGAVLHHSVLQSADLSGASLDHADLRAAILVMTHLNRTDFYGADLSGADLYGANLNGANLNGVNLSEADLSWADLSGADLYEAELHGTNLSWADLREVIGLKQEQLDAAFGNASTQLPEGFIRPESWGR
jgi:Pentapeptide repeats (8 copies)